jgi:hypothetical protein
MKKAFLALSASLLAGITSSLAQEPQQGPPSPEAGSAAAELLKGVDVKLLTAADVAPVPPAAQPPTEAMVPEAACMPNNRFWTSAEYLLWWIKGSPLPPLMTQGPPGLLGAPGVNVVLGGDELNDNQRSGGRFSAGYYLDDNRTWAVEGSYFFLGRDFSKASVFSAGPNNANILFIPIINPAIPPPSIGAIQIYATPTVGNTLGGFGFGGVTVSTFVQGAELNVVGKLYDGCLSLGGMGDFGKLSLGMLGGLRYFQLHEDLTFEAINGAIVTPQFFATSDQFNTDNQFYGGQLGLQLDWTRGRYFASATGKVALGSIQQAVDIGGTTTGNVNTGLKFNGTVPGGTFAQGTNFGHHTGSDFGALGELTLKAGVRLTRHISVFAGYDYLNADNMLRPGNTIDPEINLTQYPGNGHTTSGVVTTPPARPMVEFNRTDFWAQGLNFGLEFGF